MNITVLDRASLGMDTPFDKLRLLGELKIYDSTNPDEIIPRASCSDCIIINKIKITDEILEKSPRLKLICVFATGYDNVDIQSAIRHGVAVCNVPGYSTDSVALFTVATVLSLCTHLNSYRRFVSSGDYTQAGLANRLVPVYHEIKGKTWGLIGCGNIGKAVARVADALGARVIVNKRNPSSDFNCVDINTLCSESDIISIHCPLTDETRKIISGDKIDIMKQGVILVNEARGAVVDEEYVASAVLSGKIGGFGCDVYSTEPFSFEHPYNKIKHLDNVILTPHAAWGAYEARVRCLDIICDNIKAFSEGKILNRVDK